MRIEELRKLPDDTYVLYRNEWVCKVKIYEGRRYLLSNIPELQGSYPNEIRTDEFRCGWYMCSKYDVDGCFYHKSLKLFCRDGRRRL